MTTDDPELLDTKAAAKLLGISAITLRRQRCEGQRDNRIPLIPFCKISAKCVRYKRSTLQAFLDGLEEQGREQQMGTPHVVRNGRGGA